MITEAAVNEPLTEALTRLVAECEADDRTATPAPWDWLDEVFLWNSTADESVLQHAHPREVDWPVSEGNKLAIANGRNRLPELVRLLKDAVRRLTFLEQLAIEGNKTRDGLREQLTQRDAAIKRIVPYVLATISDGNAHKADTLQPEWRAIHDGRRKSSVLQLEQLMKIARGVP